MIAGPDTKYMMIWCGKWRPVVCMWTAQNVPTTLALHAAKAVIWCKEPPHNEWVAVAVNPGEVIERFDRDPERRKWDTIC
jgi:hypothetical protein